jgi:hypothetical protein
MLLAVHASPQGGRAPRTSSPCCSLSSPKRRGCERNARTRNGSPPDKGASMSMELQYDKRTRPRTSHYGVGRYWILEGKCIFKATLSLSLSLSGCSTEPLETFRWGTYFVRTSSPLVAMACSNMSKMIDHQRSTKTVTSPRRPTLTSDKHERTDNPARTLVHIVHMHLHLPLPRWTGI